MSNRSLCGDYALPPPPAEITDEMILPGGELRPHWGTFVERLDKLGQTELHRRWGQSQRLIHENGVSYNVYGDRAGMDRQWQLDPIPLVLDPVEWAQLEKGLIQRAKLLDLIVADFYGAQQILRERWLPPELIFGNPGFLRACHGMPVAGGRWLHRYAADLGRGADGRFCVLGDRTQSPAGAGYALENRIVISRTIPEVFGDCKVQRLAGFFRSMQESHRALTPHNRDNPRIVLLTPGPYNESYFEHAYLARYLGYTLVEGADLTVRDNRVYLKTLAGLQQVDVIVRRQDDLFCDPLELKPDSALGIPGLLQAVFAGNVAVANALGTGVIDAPAMIPFIPNLCQQLLHEELLLPSAETYWCGAPYWLQHVLSDLKRYVIKPAYHKAGRQPIFAGSLAADELVILRQKLLANPSRYIAQEQIGLSTAPVLTAGRLEPRYVVLRAHLVAHGAGYVVMPGGLARFSGRTDSKVVSMQQGGGSKDTWITASGPVDTFSLLTPPGQALTLSRGGGELPSRLADNLFWLGRYVERAEGLVRLARVILTRLLNNQNRETNPELMVLLGVLPGGTEHNHGGEVAEYLMETLLDPQHPQGLRASLVSIEGVARLVRDRISIDAWRIINRFSEQALEQRVVQPSNDYNQVLSGLDQLVISFSAFHGLAMESMTRGHAWRFQDMGRRLERALATIHLLKETLATSTPPDEVLMEAVLEVADSAMTYRRRYMTALQLAPLLDLLLADESSPRCIAFQLARLAEHLAQLPRHGQDASMSIEERLVLRALTDLRLSDFARNPLLDAQGKPVQLRNFLEQQTKQLSVLSDVLSQSYLAHSVVSRQLSGLWGEG